MRDAVLVWQPFDGKRFTEDPVPVVEGTQFASTSMRGAFGASADGQVLVYGAEKADFSQLTWFDRTGTPAGTIGKPGIIGQARVSADGLKIALPLPDRGGGNRDLWIIDTKLGTEARVTSEPANDWFAVWSPDGKRLAFGSDRHGGPGHKPWLKLALDPESAEVPLLDPSEQSVEPVHLSAALGSPVFFSSLETSGSVTVVKPFPDEAWNRRDNNSPTANALGSTSGLC